MKYWTQRSIMGTKSKQFFAFFSEIKDFEIDMEKNNSNTLQYENALSSNCTLYSNTCSFSSPFSVCAKKNIHQNRLYCGFHFLLLPFTNIFIFVCKCQISIERIFTLLLSNKQQQQQQQQDMYMTRKKAFLQYHYFLFYVIPSSLYESSLFIVYN